MMKEIRFALLLLLFVGNAQIAHADLIDMPPAVPAADVNASELLPPPAKARASQVRTQKMSSVPGDSDQLVVLELFSTQACTFCPKADVLMNGYAQRSNIIALSCHVDYFDVKRGSFALPICSTRQNKYEQAFNLGPKYTPQIVLNGKHDAIGYRPQDVRHAIAKAQDDNLWEVMISPVNSATSLAVLPALPKGDYQIWLLVYEDILAHTVQDGANKGKVFSYYNVVRSAGFLGKWDGRMKALKFKPKLQRQSKGYALLVQDMKTMKIVAAGKFEN